MPFFLVGGTALGLGRGDDIYPLVDLPRTYVVVVRPDFGVSTVEAYGWYDAGAAAHRARAGAKAAAGALAGMGGDPAQRPRAGRSPGTIPRLHGSGTRSIDAGAVVAAMSGSGSAVFGLFDRLDAARRTAADLSRPGWQVVCTRTLSRAEYNRASCVRCLPLAGGLV